MPLVPPHGCGHVCRAGDCVLHQRELYPDPGGQRPPPRHQARYNMGGWPTTAFLTPEGEIITGATYIPPTQMPRMMSQVLQAYRGNKAAFYSRLPRSPGNANKPAARARDRTRASRGAL